MMTARQMISSLTAVAEEKLDQAYLPPERLFRYGVEDTGADARRPSPRYSAMVALGLMRRAAALGADVRADALRSRVADVIDALHWRVAGKVCLTTMRPEAFSVGDLGLVLWLDAAAARGDSGETFERLCRATASFSEDHLARVTAMELAWMLLGCVAAREDLASAGPAAQAVCGFLTERLLVPETHLLRHRATGCRRRLANFADQIYAVLALARYAEAFGDRERLRMAARTARTLVERQGPDGQWPWLFHAKRGTVATAYPVFAVHQYGMAPMALAALDEAGGPSFVEAVENGLGWVFGGNELGEAMADPESGRFCRAIERPGAAARWSVARQVLLTRRASADPWAARPPRLVVNRAARSYELGWLLYAWCGREAAPRKGKFLVYSGTSMWLSD